MPKPNLELINKGARVKLRCCKTTTSIILHDFTHLLIIDPWHNLILSFDRLVLQQWSLNIISGLYIS